MHHEAAPTADACPPFAAAGGGRQAHWRSAQPAVVDHHERSGRKTQVNMEIREPAICPRCGEHALPRDLRSILWARGDEACLTATLCCRSCGQLFKTQSLGPAELTGTAIDDEDESELAEEVRGLDTPSGTSSFLDDLRRIEDK